MRNQAYSTPSDPFWQLLAGSLVITVVIAVAFAPEPPPVDAAVPFADIMCDSDMECEEATGYPYDVAMQPDAPKYPRLVGIGCEGTNGAPIYAFEEDHFPRCREIWAMDWDWQERM